MLTIQPNHLESVLIAASKEEARYYLNGVYFHNKDGNLFLVATDGHRMIRIDGGACEPFESFILESATATKALKLVKMLAKEYKPIAHMIRLDVDTGAKTIRLVIRNNEGELQKEHDSIAYRPIDGTFPDYERVIPAHDSIEAISQVSINGAYYADMAKAMQIYTGTKCAHPRLTFTKDYGPMLVHTNSRDSDGFFGVLMPMKIVS